MRTFLLRASRLTQGSPGDQLIRDLADRSVADVQRRLRSDLHGMNVAELRGYVRARAFRPVRRLAEQIAAERGWASDLASDLLNRTLERSVQLVMRRLTAQPLVLVPVQRAG